MKIRLCIASFVFMTVFALAGKSQDSIPSHSSVRLEFGLGPGFVDLTPGFSGRVAFSVIKSNWGGIIRLSVLNGEEGISKSGWLRFGPPIEQFYDNAILMSRVLKNRKSSQFIASVGFGTFYGEKLDETMTDLVSIKRQPGFAYELNFASTRSVIGGSLSIMGNINSERSIFAIMLSITIGPQK
jgi:hypothetical protein